MANAHMPRARWAALAVLVTALACQEGGVVSDGRGGSEENADTDGDGLCDLTEASYGTDPGDLDSDGDGLPDGLEVALGYRPDDSASPRDGTLTVLDSENAYGAEVLLTLDAPGDGGNYQGALLLLSSPYADLPEASALFEGAQAVSALPPDNVRAVQSVEERFISVSGATQLTFRLRFALDPEDEPPCVAALPFAYAVYNDEGREEDQIFRALLIGQHSSPLVAEEFCSAVNCF